MHANMDEVKVLHCFKGCFQLLITTNESAANIIDGIVQLYVLYHKPDNFQCVAEMVLDHLPKPSRSDFVVNIFKENSIKFFGRKQRGTSKIL